ncbi:MAG: hypothetical protein AB8H79_00190 [Myxococcota bacterium]
MRAAVEFLILTGLMVACTPDLTPTWATDTMHVEASADGVYGFHTWTFYGERWDKRRGERHHACTLVFEVALTGGSDSCEGCERTWIATESLADSDCDPAWTWDPPQLNGLAVGPVAPEIAGQAPWPDAVLGTFAQYDDSDWIAHGWAIPESQIDEATVPLTGWPAWTWPVLP